MGERDMNRQQIVDGLRETWRSIDEVCAGLTEERWDVATANPGWSVKDNVSHMIGTESMLLGLTAPEYDASEAAHVRNDIGRFNEAWVGTRRTVPGESVLEEFREVTSRRLGALDGMTDEDFAKDSWTPAGQDRKSV